MSVTGLNRVGVKDHSVLSLSVARVVCQDVFSGLQVGLESALGAISKGRAEMSFYEIFELLYR